MSVHHFKLQSILNAQDAILQKKVFIRLLYLGKTCILLQPKLNLKASHKYQLIISFFFSMHRKIEMLF